MAALEDRVGSQHTGKDSGYLYEISFLLTKARTIDEYEKITREIESDENYKGNLVGLLFQAKNH